MYSCNKMKFCCLIQKKPTQQEQVVGLDFFFFWQIILLLLISFYLYDFALYYEVWKWMFNAKVYLNGTSIGDDFVLHVIVPQSPLCQILHQVLVHNLD